MTRPPASEAGVTPLPTQRLGEISGTEGEALVAVEGEQLTTAELARRYVGARREIDELRRKQQAGVRAVQTEAELRPWQVELLKLQRHLEVANMRMIVVFEGRDAAGK